MLCKKDEGTLKRLIKLNMIKLKCYVFGLGLPLNKITVTVNTHTIVLQMSRLLLEC